MKKKGNGGTNFLLARETSRPPRLARACSRGECARAARKLSADVLASRVSDEEVGICDGDICARLPHLGRAFAVPTETQNVLAGL